MNVTDGASGSRVPRLLAAHTAELGAGPWAPDSREDSQSQVQRNFGKAAPGPGGSVPGQSPRMCLLGSRRCGHLWAALRAGLSILSLLANAAPKCQFSFNKTLTMTRLSPHTLGRKKEHVPGGELAEVRGKILREAGMERPQSPPAQAFLQALEIVHELQVRAY